MKIVDVKISVRLDPTEYGMSTYLWYVEELVDRLKKSLRRILPKIDLKKDSVVDVTYYVREE